MQFFPAACELLSVYNSNSERRSLILLPGPAVFLLIALGCGITAIILCHNTTSVQDLEVAGIQPDTRVAEEDEKTPMIQKSQDFN